MSNNPLEAVTQAVIRGNLRVGQALEKVAATGDCRQVARALLNNPGDKQK